MDMNTFIVSLYQVLDSFAFLMIAAIGLSIIYGMMGIINMAHGEFIMLGAYITTLAARWGLPLGAAILAGSLGVAIFGGVIDRLLMCRLYNRPLDSIAVTWGLSLILSQGMLILMGPTLPVVTAPFGHVAIGGSTYQVYRLIIIGIAFVIPVILYYVFSATRFGIESRATMQRPESAGMLGINTKKMYAITFMVGSGLAGFAGGLYAPTMTIAPTMGQSFQMQSFVTVVVGGVNPLVGTVTSAGFLGVVQGLVSMALTSFFGRMALLLVAILVLRMLPGGMSLLVERIHERRMEGKQANEKNR
ncbi:MAG: branched-chain amino acid ABC transporter permease [Lachnospiraceae bacterium]|nr:branched-chain amino acid ABC transporter permease [Lachnospiraceae bacterium]